MSAGRQVFLNIITNRFLEVLFLILESGYIWIKAVEFLVQWVVFFEIERLLFCFLGFFWNFVLCSFQTFTEIKRII